MFAFFKVLQEHGQITRNREIFREDVCSENKYGSHLRHARFESRVVTGSNEVSPVS